MRSWIDDEFYALRAYMCYFIKMTYLNSDIDETKVNKHPVVSFDYFKTWTLNGSKMDGESAVEYYTRLFLN